MVERKNNSSQVLALMMTVVWSVVICHLSFSGCASMGHPDGGWFDDTPPKVVGSSPADRGTNVKAQRVTINFNEYIKVEDVQSKCVISPPQMEQAEIKATGKRIIIDLKDTLKANTTYTIDFSDAIVDNNEGNPMGNYTFSFSTGEQIDTLEVSGYVLNAEDLEPVKGIMVGLYPVDSILNNDSTFHKQPMARVSRTNGSGRFTIKGVAPGDYYCYALKDDDGDLVYGQKSETVAFLHNPITPTSKPDIRQDTIWTDSLHISSILRVEYTHFLPDDVTLLCFQAPQTDRFLVKTERHEPEKLGLFFSYGSDSLPKMRGLNFDCDTAFIIEPSSRLDTIYYWLRDTALVHQDTLRYELTYEMTDSSGVLVERTDTIESIPKLSYAKRQKLEQKKIEEWTKQQEKKKKRHEPYDSIMPPEVLKPKISTQGRMAPNENVLIETPEPLAYCDTAAIHLYVKIDTLWYEALRQIDQIEARVYRVMAEWSPDTEYSLEIDSAAMRGIYGSVSGPVKLGLKVSGLDEFSTLVIDVSGTGVDTSRVVVQLMNGSGKFICEATVKNGSAEFYYVAPGKYYLRAFIDENRNGLWDTGDYDAGRQPEPVFFYHEAIDCKAKWDVSRSWRLDDRPRYQQKPAAIVKQKPDKEKQLRNRNAQRAAEKGLQYVEK